MNVTQGRLKPRLAPSIVARFIPLPAHFVTRFAAGRANPCATPARANHGADMRGPFDSSQFWRFQIVGWGLLAIATFPIKLVAYSTLPTAILITLAREPLGLLLSSLLRPIYRRFHPGEARHARFAALILLASAVAGAIDMAVGRIVATAFNESENAIISFGIFCVRWALYLVWSLLYFWIKAQREARERELRLAHADTARRDAELQLLRAQVNPHFLFNALNTIVATLEPTQARPRTVVEGLAAYLRYSLQHRHDATVPLGAEYDAIVNYLAVEQARFQGELLTDCAIDPTLRDTPVPGVLIQPLVENAIKYTRHTSEPPYRVRLRIHAPAPGAVEIEVANTGTWVEPNSAPGPHGTGIENLLRRLTLLYPNSHRLERTAARGWVIVRLIISAHALPPSSPRSTAVPLAAAAVR